MAIYSRLLVSAITFTIIAFAEPVPLPDGHCKYNLVGNMEGTRGCTALSHHNYITIQCDGSAPQSSLRKMFAKFVQYGCQKPLNLQLQQPNFPINADLFAPVRHFLYRLEMFGLKPHVNLSHAFHDLPKLEVLTLQFSDAIKSKPFTIKNDVLAGLENLAFLRVYASSVPVIMERHVFETLENLRCLYISGDQFACGCGFSDFITWKTERKSAMLRKIKDHYSHIKDTCASNVQCRLLLSQPHETCD